MRLIDYLGCQLKDDRVVELLERHDIEVKYQFDRLRENSRDEYFASAPDAGFQLCFDQQQKLKTIFCHVQSQDGFSAIDHAIVGVALFESLAAAKAAAAKEGLSYQHNDDMEFLGRRLGWICFERAGRKIHYEYSFGALYLVTLSLPDAKAA